MPQVGTRLCPVRHRPARRARVVSGAAAAVSGATSDGSVVEAGPPATVGPPTVGPPTVGPAAAADEDDGEVAGVP
jgi:hypothetical protein